MAFPEFTLHCELKHLTSEVTKNDVLIFNQKGIDFLLAEDRRLRRLPFYRLFLSGGLVSPTARRFALQWGILVIEPERLPLSMVHGLSGCVVSGLKDVAPETQDEAWEEIPRLIVPLQERLRRAASSLDSGEQFVGLNRLDWAIDFIQRIVGDYYWNALDEIDPCWLEERYSALRLDRMAGED